MSEPKPTPAWTYSPQLDGIRGYAVYVVIFYHAAVGGFTSGFIMLDMFFVLSGFLVTNVIFAEIQKNNRLGLAHYYARRVRRLLPAAIVTIVLVCGVFVLVASTPERLAMVRQAQAALVYMANWQFIIESHDYFATDIAQSPFMHFWSLSLEEQYYIFFPLLIIAVHKFWPHRLRVMMGVFGVLFVLSLTSQFLSAAHDPIRAYYATDARLYQILAGAIMALVLREFAGSKYDAERKIWWPRLGPVLAGVSLVAFIVLATELIPLSISHRGMVSTIACVGLVVGIYTAPHSLSSKIFALPLMVYLGKISYAIYLYHWPVVMVVGQLLDIRPLGVALISSVLSTALAALSYQVLETPIRRGRLLEGLNVQVVVTGVTASVLAALFIVGPVLRADRPPVIAAANSAATNPVTDAAPHLQESNGGGGVRLADPTPNGIDFEAIADEKGVEFQWCTPQTPEDCLLVDNDGLHVLLVGDSHARMLVPAFEGRAGRLRRS